MFVRVLVMLRRNLSNFVKNCLVLLVIIFLLNSLKFQEEMWDKIQNFLEIVLNTMVWLYVMVKNSPKTNL